MAHHGRRTPAVDIHGGKDAWTVVVDLPGCAREDVDLSVANGKLVLEARPHRPDLPASAVLQRRESAGAPFGRTLSLDPELDTERATAKLDRGVLTVWIPKRAKEAERKVTID